jgi:hypothetical protein
MSVHTNVKSQSVKADCDDFRPTTDLCMPLSAEGYAVHPKWQNDPVLRQARPATRSCGFSRSSSSSSIIEPVIAAGSDDQAARFLAREARSNRRRHPPSRILRDRLRVTEGQFLAVVRGRVSGEAELATEVEPIPGWLVTRLIFRLGLSEEDVARMTAEEAQAAWTEHQTRLKAATHEHTLPGDAPINALVGLVRSAQLSAVTARWRLAMPDSRLACRRI